MTPIDTAIARMKELEAKATPGPWVRAFDELTEEEYIESNPPCGIRFYGKGAYNCYNDADFIAFARQFVPQIIAAYEELKRGEYICRKCGIRKDSDHDTTGAF